MGSSILNSIGLGNLDIGIILAVLATLFIIVLVLAVINTVRLNKLTKKYNFFMHGRAAKSLESEIFNIFEENRALREDVDKAAGDIKDIFRTLKDTYQKLGLVKYDAFEQMGGKLSFCLALLDERDNGFVLNSVHSTDSSYSYIKRITDGKSNIELSREESEALKRATGYEASGEMTNTAESGL